MFYLLTFRLFVCIISKKSNTNYTKGVFMENFPKGKFLTTVKIGPKGQIVIPKEVRDMFSLNTGDSLLLMADKGQGIALQPFSYMETLWNAVNNVKNGDKDKK